MSDWLPTRPPLPAPPLDPPGGWWALGVLAAIGLVITGLCVAKLLLRRRPAAAASPDAAAGPRVELIGGARAKPPPATGTPGGRDPSPPGLPPGEEARLKRVRAVADFLDNSLTIPGLGYPIGWDSVIGLVPGVGDAATAALALWIVLQGHKLGVPKRTLMRMCGNAGLDLAGGTVPGVGDLFDVVFKANRKNLRLIERHLAEPPPGRRALPQD